MPAFKFKMAEHVTVPVLNVPGRVYKRIETAGADNTYALVYLNDICGPTLLDHLVSEGDLAAAQPVPVEEQVAERVAAAVGKTGKTLLPELGPILTGKGSKASRSKKRSTRR